MLKAYKYIPSTIKTPQRLNMELSGVCLGLRNVLILIRMKNNWGSYDVTMMSMESQGLYGGWWLRVKRCKSKGGVEERWGQGRDKEAQSPYIIPGFYVYNFVILCTKSVKCGKDSWLHIGTKRGWLHLVYTFKKKV